MVTVFKIPGCSVSKSARCVNKTSNIALRSPALQVKQMIMFSFMSV